MSLFEELRRRKVIRTGIGYLGVAFIALQAADLTFEPLGLPSWSYLAIVIAAIAGLPVALLLSWFFDLSRADAVATPAAPRAHRPRAATVLLLTTIALALLGATAFTAFRLTRKAASDTAVLAVFPFTVRSAGSLAYVGEGIVDLLSRNLDGAGVRTIAPEMMMTLMDKNKGTIDPQRAAELAREAGATLFVLGSITQLAGEVQLSAALHEVDATELDGEARSVRGDTAKLFSLIDQLSGQLMVARTGREGKHLADVAAMTTTSVAALREYVEGERYYRATRSDSAIIRFENAIALDSTFAVAHYRLAMAALGDGDAERAIRATEAALRHGSGLTERDRRFIDALSCFVQGRIDEAEQRYRALRADYPGDLEATFQLAETILHFNPPRGRPVTEARGLYEEVRKADPGFFCITCGLGGVMIVERDWANMAALTGGLPQGSPLRDTLVFASLAQIVKGDSAVRARVLNRFERASDRELTGLTNMLVGTRQDYAGAERLLNYTAQSQRSAQVKTFASNMRAYIAIARARVAEHVRLRDSALPPGQRRLVGIRVYYGDFPFLPFTREQLLGFRDEWQAADSVASENPPNAEVGMFPYHRLYALGTLSARLDDTTAALAYADRIEKSAVKPEWKPTVDGLANEIRVHVAARQGRVKEALAIVEKIPTIAPLDLTAAHYPPFTTIYWRAELLFQNNRDDEAIRWFQNAFHFSHDVEVFQPIIDLRLAQLFERKGDRAKAMEHYAAFLRQWDGADPDATPLLDQARAAMQRLQAR